MNNPKVFISYSWSSPEHEQRVLNIAKELVENGVDTIIDKWSLREGDDADAFMEQMVSDPDIQKVLIICDKMYSEKSDKRKGGAGTEAQIISRKIYEQTEEGKFVVAAFEMNEETGKPYLPIYYGSRKYIDFTDPNKYAEKFEELIRWIFNKPLYVKPQLGRIPDYILSDNKKTLGTTAAFKRAQSLIYEGRPNAMGALHEYLSRFSTNLSIFQLPSYKEGDDYYSQVINSINDFVSYREEWLDVLNSVCDNNLLPDVMNNYLRFFEDIHKYTNQRNGISYLYDQEEDNMKFIEYELMLCFIALLLKKECYKAVADILSATFYNSGATTEYDVTYTYTGFNHFLNSFFYHNERSSNKYYSLQAKIVNDRMASCEFLKMQDICQADFVCWLYQIGHPKNSDRWFPHSLLYACYMRRPFEMFARAESLRYLESMKVVFDYKDKIDFLRLFSVIMEKSDSVIPRWDFESPNIKLLMNIDKLGTRK